MTGSVEGKKVRAWVVKAEPLIVQVYPANQKKSPEK